VTDNQGDKASNAMQLISNLETLVRERTVERDQYKMMYWGAKVYKSESFWLGAMCGGGFSIVIGVVGWWVTKG
jgi:hypothetical protein